MRAGIREYTLDLNRYHLHYRRLGNDVPYLLRDLWLYPRGQNLRICLSPEGDGENITSNYCFDDRRQAWEQALHWNGHGDPTGWIRHINTGRRQEFDADQNLIRQWVAM